MAGTAVIAGATGYLGGYVAAAARSAGYRVRALARDARRLDSDSCDEIFEGQATQEGSLEGLYDDAKVAFSSIGIRHFRRHPTIWDVDAGANLNLVSAAERAGVRRFVFVSVLGAPELRTHLPVAEARERVVDRLRQSAMEWAVLRPSGFFNDMREYYSMAARGRVWLIGSGEHRLSPIHGADLAAEAVACFAAAEPRTERDVGGPETLTQRQIGELAFEAAGKVARFSRVPSWLLEGTASVAAPFNVNLATFLRMFALLGKRDAVAPPCGSHTLAGFFAELAAAS